MVAPSHVDELADVLTGVPERGVIARGLGRSYGDPAQNADGLVAETTRISGVVDFESERGVVTVLSGTSIEALLRWVVPKGWFVPVTPGTRHVTVGGAIAADIHGKNHHRSGSFCDAVEAITIVTPAGGRRRVGPDAEPELFWATAGGMGLTGLILDATIRLQPIETSRLVVDTDRTPDLDATIEAMATGDDAYAYSVAWIDLMTTGRRMGRGILDRANFATRDQVTGREVDPLTYRPRSLLRYPPLPLNLINRPNARAFNELWYRKAPRRRRGNLQSISRYFHPLDLVSGWNRVYGRVGMLEWQCVVPLGAEDDLRWLVARISGSGRPSFLSVLKRFGPANAGPLSFPLEGWTLAVDLPAVDDPDLVTLLDELDERVVSVGGRLYLAKDSRMRPEMLPAMYPRLDEWRAVRDGADPDGVFVSDQSRRLGLTG